MRRVLPLNNSIMFSLSKKKLERDRVLCLKVKVRPNAAVSQVKDIMADKTVKVDIAAPAVKGEANRELIKFLAGEFSVSRDRIIIASGAGEKSKLIKINKLGI